MSGNEVKDEIKALVREAGIRMIDSGLTVCTWGNVSYCDRETGLVYITPSGMDYHSLRDDDICVYDLACRHVEGVRRPSIELHMHVGCFNARPEANAVLHTHPIYSTVFSSMGEDVPVNIHDEAAQALGDTIRCAEYELPGTQELAEAVVKALGSESNAAMMRNHGLVCIGQSMDDAFKVSTVVEMVCEIYWRIRATGGTYIPISDENVAIMKEFARTKYGQY
ncbi:MAG: class II aldolase/adducin family protein [Collinsella sp.]|nr:class II aldolase/adducin family protein [Collinsella sp.]